MLLTFSLYVDLMESYINSHPVAYEVKILLRSSHILGHWK